MPILSNSSSELSLTFCAGALAGAAFASGILIAHYDWQLSLVYSNHKTAVDAARLEARTAAEEALFSSQTARVGLLCRRWYFGDSRPIGQNLPQLRKEICNGK